MSKIFIAGVMTFAVVAGGGYYFIYANETASPTKENSSDKVPETINQMPLNSGENPAPGSSVHDLPVEPAAAIARKDLAAKLSVAEKSIVIMQITEKTWNDGCLGLGKAHESCLQALVPGFRVEMQSAGKTYFYRTDKTGESIRIEDENI